MAAASCPCPKSADLEVNFLISPAEQLLLRQAYVHSLFSHHFTNVPFISCFLAEGCQLQAKDLSRQTESFPLNESSPRAQRAGV